MSVSALFLLDVKGRPLIYRDYRGDVSTKHADRFIQRVHELEDGGKLTPIINDEGVTCAAADGGRGGGVSSGGAQHARVLLRAGGGAACAGVGRSFCLARGAPRSSPPPRCTHPWHRSYIWVLHANVYLLAVTRDNVNAASVVVGCQAEHPTQAHATSQQRAAGALGRLPAQLRRRARSSASVLAHGAHPRIPPCPHAPTPGPRPSCTG